MSSTSREYRFPRWNCSCFCKPTCIPISIISIVIGVILVLSIMDQNMDKDLHLRADWVNCQKSCQASLVESIPIGLEFNSTVPAHLSTYNAWVQLLESAEKEINIGSFYWSLQGKQFNHSTGDEGKDVFRRLKEAGLQRRISIKIAQDLDSKSYPNYDTHDLEDAGAAEVRRLNFSKLIGSGVLHTKMWIVDGRHAYLGSANLDWRSLTQVKELGILVTNCSCWVQDLKKIFDVYWILGESFKIPDKWPPALQTDFNSKNPMSIAFNGTNYTTFISSSPNSFCPKGRNVDLDGILKLIDEAESFVQIAVMDYFPGTLYTREHHYWPEIDNRLRSAAIDRNVRIRLLMSKWNDTRESAFYFLKSLQDLNGVFPHVDVQVKLFQVPATPDQAKIPFARVNHNKYMVTDKAAYIGTSNWSADYFISTAGVGVIVSSKGNSSNSIGGDDLRMQLVHIFARDWDSKYASSLP